MKKSIYIIFTLSFFLIQCKKETITPEENTVEENITLKVELNRFGKNGYYLVCSTNPSKEITIDYGICYTTNQNPSFTLDDAGVNKTSKTITIDTEKKLAIDYLPYAIIQNDQKYLIRGYLKTETKTFYSGTKELYLTGSISGSWEQVSDFAGFARDYATDFVINDTAYVGFGWDAEYNYGKDFYRYIEVQDNWESINTFTGAERVSAIGFTSDGYGYVGLGFNDFNPSNGDEDRNYLKDIWRYSPAENNWIEYDSFFGESRKNAVVFDLNGQIFIGLGKNDTGNLTDIYQYDIANKKWYQKTSFPNSQNVEAYFSVDNKGYVLTGDGGLYMYDANNNIWQEKTGIISEAGIYTIQEFQSMESFEIVGTLGTFENYKGTDINNRGYLVSADANWVYNTEFDAWTEIESNQEVTVREHATMTSFNGSLYYGLGVTSQNGNYYQYNDFWKFTPNE